MTAGDFREVPSYRINNEASLFASERVWGGPRGVREGRQREGSGRSVVGHGAAPPLGALGALPAPRPGGPAPSLPPQVSRSSL